MSTSKSSEPLQPCELDKALRLHVVKVREECFSEELNAIKDNTCLSAQFRKLSSFIYESGVLSVGGRLRHDNLLREHKHPQPYYPEHIG